MGATAADTQREIGALRDDASATLETLRARVGGGIGSMLGREARGFAGPRPESQRPRDVGEVVRQNQAALTVGATVAAGVVAFAVYSGLERWRGSRRPRNRVRAKVQKARGEVESRLDEGRKRLDETRHWAEEAMRRGVLLKVEREGDDYLRVKEAKFDLPEHEEGSRKNVLKNLLWAGMLALFMAGAGVAARRAAGAIWQATLREEPPSERN